MDFSHGLRDVSSRGAGSPLAMLLSVLLGIDPATDRTNVPLLRAPVRFAGGADV